MEGNIIFEILPSCLKRLTRYDVSDKFQIIFNLLKTNTNSNIKFEKHQTATIYTTINKARVISKKIDDIYQIDPTINEYEINILSKGNNKSEEINKIKNVINNMIESIDAKVKISKDQLTYFSIIRHLLGEKDDQINNQLNDIINSQEEAISLLNTEFHDLSVDYLSQNFLKLIQSHHLINLSKEIVFEIIDSFFIQCSKHNDNQKSTEITKIYEELKKEEEERYILMHFLLSIDPLELNNEMIDYFYESIDDEIINDELPKIIFMIKHHLLDSIKDKEKKKKNEKPINAIECKFEGNELSGIINYITQRNGQNALSLSGGGSINSSFPLTNLIKYDQNNINKYYFNYFDNQPKKESDGWIEFDFISNKVNITSYTIRSNAGGPNEQYHPKSWRIVGSNDKLNWELIDHKVNNPEVNSRYKQHRFDVEGNYNYKYYRYIRYIQEDNWRSSKESGNVYICCFEFFGSICNESLA